jgi:DNA-3-methyladenine glycosylase I
LRVGLRKCRSTKVAGASAFPDGKPRCSWVNPNNPHYIAYHDGEWGVERDLDDDGLFELLCLEGFQAGLSWETVLNKRESFRRAFRGFAVEKVARMGPRDVERLLRNPDLIRNRAKIEAALRNARAVRTLRKEGASFSAFLEPYRPGRRRKSRRTGPVPCSSAESEALSRAMKSRGFSFVGPVILYSFMQAIGWVDDHEPGCFLAR